jgi:hypothetical protein
MQPILQAISGDICIKLDEITSLIIVAEAGDEFPQHLVQKIIGLPADKRKMLLDVVGAWVGIILIGLLIGFSHCRIQN